MLLDLYYDVLLLYYDLMILLIDLDLYVGNFKSFHLSNTIFFI